MKLFEVFDGQHPFAMTDIEHVAKASEEMFLWLATAMVPPGSNHAVITGCEMTESGGSTTIQPGLVYWNDGTKKRLCLVEGKSLPITLLSNLKLAYSKGPADGLPTTVLYKNGIPRQIYFDERLEFVAATDPRPGFLVTALNYRYMNDRPGQVMVWHPRPGQVVTNYFDIDTGLGKNEFLGYAICDGRNDTPNYMGRTLIGWVPRSDAGEDNVREADEYRTIGQVFGERKHAITVSEMAEHEHDYGSTNTGNDYDGSGGNSWIATNPATPSGHKTTKTGGGAPHENRQPSIVAVFYQKL